MEKLRFGELFQAQVSSVTSVTPDSCPCLLSPSESNIHKIESVGGPAAFLDILAPPYNIDPDPYMDDQEERDCHYFRVLSEPVAEVGNLFAIDQNLLNVMIQDSPGHHWLMMCDPPASFYCDTEQYSGPSIRDTLT